jgi:hypothetical protein
MPVALLTNCWASCNSLSSGDLRGEGVLGFALETPLEWLVAFLGFLSDAFFGEGVFGDGAIAIVGGP